jgi:hypothetical protein
MYNRPKYLALFYAAKNLIKFIDVRNEGLSKSKQEKTRRKEREIPKPGAFLSQACNMIYWKPLLSALY